MNAGGLVSLVLAAGCLVAGLCALRALRRRLALVARAEHELRGPATALALACRRMRQDPHTAAYADVLEGQLERLRAGLDDLLVARRGGSPVAPSASPVELASFVRVAVEPWRAKLRRCSVDWRAGAAVAVADRGRLARALGNLLANSAEHGDGDLRVRARRVEGAVRLELRNGHPDRLGNRGAPGPRSASPSCAQGERGRGLAIAAEAARELGGRLLVHTDEAATLAVLELPDGVRGARDGAAEPGRADEERAEPHPKPPPAGGDRARPDLVA